MYRSINKMLSPLPISGVSDSMKGGAKRRGVPVKTLKKLLKKAGLKTSGKKAALTRRAKKAHLMKGGEDAELVPGAEMKAGMIGDAVKEEDVATGVATGARRKRKSRGFKLF
jgi:transketolase N-terminal domain/subunit